MSRVAHVDCAQQTAGVGGDLLAGKPGVRLLVQGRERGIDLAKDAAVERQEPCRGEVSA